MEKLTKDDLQNILGCLSAARVEGIQAAAKLLTLFNKVQAILKAEEANGNGNGAESDKPGARQPSAAYNLHDAGN
jgi:hypothetical protein